MLTGEIRSPRGSARRGDRGVARVSFGIGSYGLAWAIGVQGYPGPARPVDACGLIDAASSLGLAVAQICDNLPLDTLSAAELDGLRHRASAAGVRVEVGTRGSDPPRLERFVGIAVALGSPILRTLLTPGASPEDTVERGRASIRAILPALEAARVTLALENYEHLPVEMLRDLVDGVGSPWVGVCLDPVNNFGAGQDAERALETLAPVAVAVHVKDFRVTRLPHNMGYELTGAPAGAGQLRIARLIAAVAEHRGSFSAVLEQWVPWQGAIAETVALEQEWARMSADCMRQLARG
jgi:3-oxoisoapionate decarboxylase